MQLIMIQGLRLRADFPFLCFRVSVVPLTSNLLFLVFSRSLSREMLLRIYVPFLMMFDALATLPFIVGVSFIPRKKE